MKIDGGAANFQQPQGMNQDQQVMKKPVEQIQEKVVEEKGNENFPGEEQLIKLIEKSNNDLPLIDTSLQFSIHEKTKEVMVKVVNNNTKEVVREIPSEKVLDMVAAMMERTGLFVDKKA